ncbi:VOC family protein [Xanthomonas translucens pv. hordei]|uniref:VOC family protein n=2 Tax=Xanthomonas campestris pv. translucens TaxID=343 RepID=UPI00100808FC|nr:VOC family protein [Xanthomonas translucens]UKE57055.1 VOC family protein [Xanthomonas translucens pv. hordei]WIH00061.1 VOC family protein [Xanthomonas translucens pv. hordei]
MSAAMPMLSHVHLGVNDFPAAFAFYAPLLQALGLQLKFRDDVRGWACWTAPHAPRPLLLIGRAFDGQPAAPGNGQMLALQASNRALVDRCHALALAQGGHCEGPPALRAHYHPDYYGAYFRDLDGNKLGVCCHRAE